ncbi:MAG: type II toxin-antitoxin system VapC family toxin [Fidelibacterota bacterium]
MITLDTHVIVWNALKSSEISIKAKQEIKRAQSVGQILIADISLWEIAMLIKKQRLVIETTYTEFMRLIMEAYPYQIIPISHEIADLSVRLSDNINLDPADRLICATSIIEGAPLITADKNLRNSDLVHTVW